MNRYLTSPHAQGTPEWHADRLGKATGSNAAAIVATLKSGGEAAARADYRMTLVLERLTGVQAEHYQSTEMVWGTEQEPFGRMAFEAATDRMVTESGFVYLPDLAAGCSVDGFVVDAGRRGIWECKCPKSKTHLGYLQEGLVPKEYLPQIVHNLWITGAEFCDFVSFDPRFPAGLQLFTVRYERVEADIRAHEIAVRQFLAEVTSAEQKLRALGRQRDVPLALAA